LVFFEKKKSKRFTKGQKLQIWFQKANWQHWSKCVHARNFDIKCEGDSLVWNQYSHRIDAEVTFYVCRFPIVFLEVFWEQHQ